MRAVAHNADMTSTILPVEKFWDRPNKTPVLLASAGMIAAIALVDWWTNFDAEYGNYFGGLISVVTKSGINQHV